MGPNKVPGISIAPATQSDSAEIVRMMAALAEHEKDPTANFDADAAARDLFSESPWIAAYLARVDSIIAGVALWHTAYETSFAARGAYIVSLWVDPQFRRIGIATRLVSAVADNVARNGGSYVWWASRPWNRAAHATYASMNAVKEPVIAHALIGEDFQRLANRHRKETVTQ